MLCEIFGNFSVTFLHCRLSMDEVKHEHVAKITASEEKKNVGTENISVLHSNIFPSNTDQKCMTLKDTIA